jgi:predicted CXXCH cytochrome family protein
LNPEECRPCHQEIFESYIQTTHFRASARPSEQTILGSFSEGKNILQTRKPTTYFRMEAEDGSFFQTAYWANIDRTEFYSRKEKIGVVMGAGIEGQSYLYWREGFLYQLPVSYLVEVDDWITSPGFVDGEVFMERPARPRCLECHGTYFEIEGTPKKPRYREGYQVGITCWKCHGDGGEHIARYTTQGAVESGPGILNPKRLSPERQLDLCALCHAGVGNLARPPFTYRPGQDLSTYLRPELNPSTDVVDEPGGWLASKLLAQSRCFTESGTLTCLTCHDLHRPAEGVAVMSRKCLQCHQASNCGQQDTIGERIETLCIDCHVPDQPSQRARVHRGSSTISAYYRNHHIGIYREATDSVLKRIGVVALQN